MRPRARGVRRAATTRCGGAQGWRRRTGYIHTGTRAACARNDAGDAAALKTGRHPGPSWVRQSAPLVDAATSAGIRTRPTAGTDCYISEMIGATVLFLGRTLHRGRGNRVELSDGGAIGEDLRSRCQQIANCEKTPHRKRQGPTARSPSARCR